MSWPPTPERLQELAQHVDEGIAEVQRVRARETETAAGFPSGYTMVGQLREALGLPPVQGRDGISPGLVLTGWDEALIEVERLKARGA